MDVDYFYPIGVKFLQSRREKMSKKIGILSLILCIIAIGLSVFALVTVYTREEPKEPKAPEKECANVLWAGALTIM